MTPLALVPMKPFGLEVQMPPGTAWEALDVEELHAWIQQHRVVLLRGLAPVAKPALPGAARRLGPLQAWSFGSVHEIEPKVKPTNYLYTTHPVPLHWDGAFTPKVPRYLLFSCLAAPGAEDGGQTVFVDTTRCWRAADEATRDRWRSLTFTYETDRVVHYGGAFSSRLVRQHPYSNETVLRFAEPVDDLNPVSVRAEGLSPLESAALLTELRHALAAPDAVLEHTWQRGDVLLADNHALLHGRRAFATGSPRQLQRINIHGPERTWRDDLRDSITIRRPEFMVAEIPVLLIPAVLASASLGALASARFALTTALFFLLFHFGDMVNCYADRDLDAVYKTHLSEAVYGLGLRSVRAQMLATVAAALGLAAWLAAGRVELLALVAGGLLVAAQYSLRPLWLKGRGAWQILTLWALIFVVPMAMVAWVFGAALDGPWLALVCAYAAMQEGIILVNTAEDLPEDTAAGIRTTAVSLGLVGSLGVATAMVAVGGAVVLAVLASWAPTSWVLWPLTLAWAWVSVEVARTAWLVRGPLPQAIERLRPRAKRMPLWLTATAWGTLLTALGVRLAA